MSGSPKAKGPSAKSPFGTSGGDSLPNSRRQTTTAPSESPSARMARSGSAQEGITLGADGNLYVTEFHAGKIAEVNLHKSKGHDVVTEFDIPTPQSRPWDIIGGPDGNIWFTESGSGKIGRLWL